MGHGAVVLTCTDHLAYLGLPRHKSLDRIAASGREILGIGYWAS
ncbi:hypothetical protein [Nostoc sp.]